MKLKNEIRRPQKLTPSDLKNPAGTSAIAAFKSVVLKAGDKGPLAYQSRFGVAHNIVNAFAADRAKGAFSVGKKVMT